MVSICFSVGMISTHSELKYFEFPGINGVVQIIGYNIRNPDSIPRQDNNIDVTEITRIPGEADIFPTDVGLGYQADILLYFILNTVFSRKIGKILTNVSIFVYIRVTLAIIGIFRPF